MMAQWLAGCPIEASSRGVVRAQPCWPGAGSRSTRGHEAFAEVLGGSTVISLAAIFALGRLPGWVKAFGRKSE